MSWLTRLQARWQLKSVFQVIIVLIVFSCTGLTVVFIKGPVLQFFFGEDPLPVWASIAYYILILPVYNIILLFYGFVFGQFRFFWDFEKRFFKRIFPGAR